MKKRTVLFVDDRFLKLRAVHRRAEALKEDILDAEVTFPVATLDNLQSDCSTLMVELLVEAEYEDDVPF